MAIDMYISQLFRGMVAYAKELGYDKLYILSAKYGLLKEDDMIEPYEATLKTKSEREKKMWAYNIIKSLKAEDIDLNNDEFIIFAGWEYRKYICQKLANYQIPLKNLRIGKQNHFLKKYKICTM